MDQEMVAFFDERLRELTRQVAEETAQQFAASREETAQQFAASREETAQQIARLREEMISGFEKGEENARYTVILVEDLRHKLELIAEAAMGTNERLDRYRAETMVELDQVKGLIKPYYRDLDGRVHHLDDRASHMDVRVDGLNGRLQVLENRAERQQGDVFDAIRKMLGKPPLPPPVTSE